MPAIPVCAWASQLTCQGRFTGSRRSYVEDFEALQILGGLFSLLERVVPGKGVHMLPQAGGDCLP